MKKPITIGFLLVPLLFSGVTLGFAEEYYYIPDHLLENPPLFCAMEFEDTELPEAQGKLMEMAENAVNAVRKAFSISAALYFPFPGRGACMATIFTGVGSVSTVMASCRVEIGAVLSLLP